MGTSTAKAAGKSSFAAWLASQEAGGGEGGSAAVSEYGGTDDFFVVRGGLRLNDGHPVVAVGVG